MSVIYLRTNVIKPGLAVPVYRPCAYHPFHLRILASGPFITRIGSGYRASRVVGTKTRILDVLGWAIAPQFGSPGSLGHRVSHITVVFSHIPSSR